MMSRARPTLRGRQKADVCVLGAGMTGCAAALELARQGKKAVVLEAGATASGASGRNLGHIATGLGCHYRAAIADFGREEARAIWQTHRENHTRLTELLPELGRSSGYERRGGFSIALSRAEAVELVESEELLREDAFSGEFLDHYLLEARFGVTGLAGAYWAEDDAVIDSGTLTRELARAAERHGAVIYEGSAVCQLDSSPAGALAVTREGAIESEVALVALNAFVGPCVPYLAERIQPLRAQCLAIANDGKLNVPSPAYADHGRVYWRLTPDRLLVGGFDDLAPEEESTDQLGTTPLIQEAIEEFARRHLGARDQPVLNRWSGIMGISRDGFPWIGPIPGTPLVAAAGFTGLGFGYALLAARWASDAIVNGRDPTPARYRAARPFQPRPWPPWSP